MFNSELTVATQLASHLDKDFSYKLKKLDQYNQDSAKYRLKAFFKGTDFNIPYKVRRYIQQSNGAYTLQHIVLRARINRILRDINRQYPAWEYTVSDIHHVNEGVTFELNRKQRVTLSAIEKHGYQHSITMMY